MMFLFVACLFAMTAELNLELLAIMNRCSVLVLALKSFVMLKE